MKRLLPQKRNQLILVIVATLSVVVLIYFFLIDPQNEGNKKLAASTNVKASELLQIKKLIKQADATAVTAADITTLLNHAEEDTAAGDVFAWTYDTMRQFKINRHIEITTIGQPTQSDVDVIPNFPYKQIRFQIVGNGYYHDIGKYVSDLENKFPNMRIINITMDTTLGSETVNEKLSFRMEVAALVKPSA